VCTEKREKKAVRVARLETLQEEWRDYGGGSEIKKFARK